MKSSRIVKLAMFAMVVFCGLETALANPTYSFTTIDAPGANGITAASGINSSGQIVGYFRAPDLFADPHALHGFLDMGGSFTIIDYSPDDEFWTQASGINNNGQIVGITAPDGEFWEALVYTGGNFTIVRNVGGCYEDIIFSGINESGQIVGTFKDATGATHGFLASPVTPTGGSFAGNVKVSLQDSEATAQIYYTLDGSAPRRPPRFTAVRSRSPGAPRSAPWPWPRS